MANLKYKLKTRILLLIGVAFLIVIYEVAIKKTTTCHADCTELERKLVGANNISGKLADLRKLNMQLDKLLGKNATGSDIQQSALDVIADFCHKNGLVLQSFPQPITNNDQNTILETNIFTVEGGFNRLLELVYLFEQRYSVGKVVSVHYKIKKDFGAKKSSLMATIYLQTIKQSKHEI